jgi:hypothetical protein
MNSAQTVIAKFGGQTALAALIGKNQSTVQHWARTGRIPAKWQPLLLELARERSLDVAPADFIATAGESEGSEPPIPKATHWGELAMGNAVLPCYVLDTGDRVFSLKGVVLGLIGTEGGQLAEYIKVKSLRPFLPGDLTPVDGDVIPALVRFDTGGEAFTQFAWGLPVEKFLDLCAAYSTALEESLRDESEVRLTDRQREIALHANTFLRACAKIGIVALVDEATGYQYDRAREALQLKLKLYLEEEMRQWEKTFPDQLWIEFGRLTNWKGPVHHRPKYWGKLVMELVYDYLDPDVAKWLRENAPKPMRGQNYHQWLSSQYGLRKLVEHIWMLVGMASACGSMEELRRKMAEKYGRVPMQLTLYLRPTMDQ